LVIDDRGVPGRTTAHQQFVRQLGAAIPGAQLAIVNPGDGPAAQVIEQFLSGLSGAAATIPEGPAPSGNAVILFTDIVDSTALTERLGDARFREASRALDERLRAAIREGGGAPVEGKVLGDGVMGAFSSAREAIAAALRCSDLSAESELGLHIGLHAGDVIRERDNVYGGTVNIAARICGMCAPGEVLVSDVVRGMARSSAGVTFIDRGEQEMKGVGEPVRVYAVVAEGRS
jgi:class 3 adenylate cyclase